MIEVQALTKTYGQYHAVNEVSFKLKKGETLALVGTSGSGKTTTLKLINRLIEPSSGAIFLEGENIFALPPEQMRRRMGYVIQNIGLFPHYTIEENVAVVPKLLGWPKEKIRERSAYLLERLKLPAQQFFPKYPHQLSGGQQQRVGIARALAADPPIILMDEPFGALDPITRNVIRQDFISMEELSSKTTVIVTHDIEEAFELADRICVLDKGKLQQLGSPQDLLFRPSNDFVRAFIADKKLDLQIRIFTLDDIFEFIPLPTHPLDEDFRELPGALSIKETMAELIGQTPDLEKVLIQKEGLRKPLNLKKLMDAFHQFTARH